MMRINFCKRKICLYLFFAAAASPFLFFTKTEAATNISAVATDHWAWNDIIGWVNFYNTATVNVFSSRLEGYADSSIGDISLNCNSTRSGDICGQSNYGVTNDGAGNLSGWGWNDQYGWISFDCNNNSGCGSSNYRAYIDSGNFRNYAWNDIVGWISFNCADPGICGTSNYRIVTSWVPASTEGWLESSTFDTGISAGAQLNSVIWQGDLPASTAVRFQFASSNSSIGPWNFMGPDGTSGTYYNTGRNAPLEINYVHHNNRRYFRYRVFLRSNILSTISPKVDDVIINWSP